MTAAPLSRSRLGAALLAGALVAGCTDYNPDYYAGGSDLLGHPAPDDDGGAPPSDLAGEPPDATGADLTGVVVDATTLPDLAVAPPPDLTSPPPPDLTPPPPPDLTSPPHPDLTQPPPDLTPPPHPDLAPPPPDLAQPPHPDLSAPPPPDLAQPPVDASKPAGPTCTFKVTPKSGDLKQEYTGALASSNAVTCVWSLDGGPASPIPCNGSFMGDGKEFGGPGNHNGLATVSGPGGTTHCDATWTIQNGPGQPSCDLVCTPMSGHLTTKYTFALTSMNATMCFASIDGQKPFSNPCNATTTYSGFAFGLGSHKAVVTANGPGGSSKCACTWSVMP